MQTVSIHTVHDRVGSGRRVSRCDKCRKLDDFGSVQNGSRDSIYAGQPARARHPSISFMCVPEAAEAMPDTK